MSFDAQHDALAEAKDPNDLRKRLLSYFEAQGWKLISDDDGIWEVQTHDGRIWDMTIPRSD